MGLPSKRTKNYCKQCQPSRAKTPTIFIVCEGYGERVYLNHFNRRDRRIQIKVSDDKRADLLVKYAIHLLDTNQIDLDSEDEIWCVFDRDEASNEQISEAQKMAIEHTIKLVYSNPCFEIWYFWHLRSSRQSWPSSQALKQKMCQLIKNYHETGDYYDLLVSKQNLAHQTAEEARNYCIRNNIEVYSRDSNPVTDIDLLIDCLMNT